MTALSLHPFLQFTKSGKVDAGESEGLFLIFAFFCMIWDAVGIMGKEKNWLALKCMSSEMTRGRLRSSL